MNTDPDELMENYIKEILKPIDDLLAKEDEILKQADEMIGAAEAKAKKVVIEAKRDDED